MRTRVQKWGNSLALRIPKPFAVEMGLEKDREVELSVVKGRLIAEALPAPSYTLDELLAGVRPTDPSARRSGNPRQQSQQS
jgi:antitoxin MazE